MRAAIAGDPKAGDVVGRWLAAEFSRFFANSFSDSSRIDDLLQSSITRVWAELADQDFRDAHELREWCLDVARRTAATTGRKARRDRQRVAQLASVQVERSASLSSMFADAEQRALLERCIERLTTPYREALRDKLNGGTARTFAEAKGVPVSTITSRRAKAEKQIKQMIAGERLTPPPAP